MEIFQKNYVSFHRLWQRLLVWTLVNTEEIGEKVDKVVAKTDFVQIKIKGRGKEYTAALQKS